MDKSIAWILAGAMGLAASGCTVKASVGTPKPPPPAAPKAEPPKAEPPKAEPPKVEAPKAAPVKKKISHVKITADHLEIDQKIHFAKNSDVIEQDSFALLDEIAEVLKGHKEIKTVHVIGHTDSRGSAAHNKDLSKRRAASVEKALRDRGITQNIDSRGAGKDEPLCKEDSDECHQKNRRVEFKIEKG